MDEIPTEFTQIEEEKRSLKARRSELDQREKNLNQQSVELRIKNNKLVAEEMRVRQLAFSL